MRRWLAWTFAIDPVMRKEFYGVSRRWQTYLFRTLYVGVLGFAIWILWVNGSDRMSYSDFAEMGRRIFILFAMFQFFLVMLGALASGSDMISKEVRAGTLPILAITPLSGWRIVFGKWKASVASVFITILSGVPILSLGIYLGGVQAEDLLRAGTLTAAAAMLCVAFGVLCSTMARGSYVTLTASVVGMTAYCLLPVLAAAILDEFTRVEFEDVVLDACWVSHAPMFVFTVAERRGVPADVAQYGWITSSLFSVALSFACLRIAAARVVKLSRAENRPPLLKRLFEKLDRLYERLPLGVTIWAERAAVWDWNPYLWKEMRARVTGRFRYFTRIMLVILVVFGLLTMTLAESLMNDEVAITVYVILMVLLILGSVGAGAGAFTKEKEENKWDILLTTPIRMGQLVGAKFAGAVVGIAHTTIMLLLFSVLAAAFHGAHREPVVTPVAACTLIFAFFTLCVGLLFSLMAGSTKRAYALTFAVVIFCLCIIPVLLAIHASFTRTISGGSDMYVDILRATNPFMQVEGVEGRTWRNVSDDLWAGTIAHGLIYVPAGLICLAICASRFHRMVGRVQ